MLAPHTKRLMDKAFDSQIGRNIEVYVDDLVVKSYTEAEMLRDIDETFRTLRKINMKLNPKKCTFGVAEGVFLGYVVTPYGIKPCPDKTAAVQLPSPRTIKEVQSLNGKLANLNRFLSKSAENLNRFLSKSSEKSLPLFKTLKKCIKKSDFHWTAEAEQAFKQLKQHLLELSLLVAPKPKEELIIYLSATYGTISAVLMTERGATQTSIYFISRALQGPELNYTPMEKLVLSLVFAAKRLRRTSVKGQILADFLIEMPDENPQAAPMAETQQESWTFFTDGSSSVDGSGAGLILTNPKGIEFTYALRFQFAASNNEAEYEALIVGLRIAAQMGVKNVRVSVDSKLVANQVLGTYVAKEENMVKYLDKVKSLVRRFTNFSISQKGGKKAPHQGPIVRINGGNSLQAVVPYAVVKMCWTAPREYVIREIHEGSCSMHTGRRLYGLLHEMDRSKGSGYNQRQLDVVSNDEELRLNLDLLEERRKRAAICEAKAKLKMTKYYNARVRGVTFRPGDFVYCSNDVSHAIAGGS
nr:reverse transcriptase domain-containing protein [Tanacetum cinerariifolium]